MSHVLLVYSATHDDLNESLERDASLLQHKKWKNTHVLLCRSNQVYYYDPVHHSAHSHRAAEPIGMKAFFTLAAEWLRVLPLSFITFLFTGHSNSFYMRPTETVYHSVAEVREMIQAVGLSFDMMIFDSCAMASLETLYEFRHCTKYILATEGYLDEDGFLNEPILSLMDNLPAQPEEKVSLILQNVARRYTRHWDQWNASLLSTHAVEDVVRMLEHTAVTDAIPFVYSGFHLVDLYGWVKDVGIRRALRETIRGVEQNALDPRHNHGLSITLGTTRWNGFVDLYESTALWKDCERVRKWHAKWDVDVRVLSINVQHCDTIEELEQWKIQFHEAEADVVCIQEISEEMVQHLARDDCIEVLSHHAEKETAVLSMMRLDLPRSVWIGSIHLDDVPSIPHHLQRQPYPENPPLDTPLPVVLEMAHARRGGDLEDTLKQANRSHATHFVLAGDFNEPSHLDLGSRHLALPISHRMASDGWVDVMYAARRAKPTWPAAGFYADEPSQRIDFIYLRGGWRVTYADRYLPRNLKNGAGWSDHYGLLCELSVKR